MQFGAEFFKLWGKLFEEDLQHASLTVSYANLTRQDEPSRHTDKGEARTVKEPAPCLKVPSA